jgi:hypothetical protein
MNIRDSESGGHAMTLTNRGANTRSLDNFEHDAGGGGDIGGEQLDNGNTSSGKFAAQYTDRMNHTSSSSAAAPLTSPHSPVGNRGSSRSQRLGTSGHNQIMRFKIKVPAGTAPTRSDGTHLGVPNVYNMNKSNTVSGEVVGTILRESDQFGFT